MLIQRDGRILEARYDLQRYRWQTVVIARNIALGVLAALLLIYSSGRLAQTAALLFLLMSAWGQGAPIGATGEATALFTLVWCIGQSLCFPVITILGQRIVYGELSRLQLSWPWSLSVIGPVLYMNYTGQGLPHELPWLLYSFLVMIPTPIVGWMIHRHYHLAPPIRRKQIQWMFAAALLTLIFTVLAVIFDTLSGDTNHQAFLFVAIIGFVVLPVAFVLAIFKVDIIPIDRAVVTTATYAIIAVGLALTLEFLIEPLAGAASTHLGMSESAGQTALIVGIALGAPVLKKRLEPIVSRSLSSYESGAEKGS